MFARNIIKLYPQKDSFIIKNVSALFFSLFVMAVFMKAICSLKCLYVAPIA